METTSDSYHIEYLRFCKYVLHTPTKAIQLSFPQMLELRRKINAKTTYKSLNAIVNNENFVLLFVADKQHLLFLEIPQLIKLKEEIAVFFETPDFILA
ncbi:hypothetical protein ICJ83_02145 [Aestuariibaculum sp. TT11]|uniref:Uncharacterized protein n=1 Tax=Aestuariibaculum sediminum TaxID=2770637 RepID=A0A8J6Q7U3_9FLAO|nr:hypothetical protein [Aestuariibaculum sediminum]